MRNYNPQKNQEEINNNLFKDYFVPSEILEDLTTTDGHNWWLDSFIKKFTHQDTFLKKNDARLQGWFKPGEYEKYNIHTPAMDVECFHPEHGLYVTIWIKTTPVEKLPE